MTMVCWEVRFRRTGELLRVAAAGQLEETVVSIRSGAALERVGRREAALLCSHGHWLARQRVKGGPSLCLEHLQKMGQL